MRKESKKKVIREEKFQNKMFNYRTLHLAQQRFGDEFGAVESRINEEMLVLKNLGVLGGIFQLKDIVDGVKSDLAVSTEPATGILAGSYVAYALGIESRNPLETGVSLNPLDFKLPLWLTIRYDNDVRNQVVDWLKGHGFEVSTYLGQPMLKLEGIRVAIQRVVK